MTKTRVYELAKELGVDNKVIAAAAAELGLKGKGSHSSSLQSDEADQIRRLLIRKAMGQSSETVTMRVDKVTGAKEAIVERRKGNVIRRRRQDTAAAEQAAPAETAEVEAGAEPQPVEPPTVEAGPIQEEEAALEAEASRPELPLADEEREEGAPALKEQVEEGGEAAEVEAAQSEAAQESVEEGEKQAEEAEGAATPKKPAIGPKVLGRIELPQKRVVTPAKAERKADAAAAATRAVIVPEEEEEDEERKGRRKGPRKKGLKREISRGDLIDYEGRDARRAGRPGGKASKAKEDAAEKKQPVEVGKTRASKRVVKMGESITVGELAKQMSLKAGEVIAKLIELGVLATINQTLDKDITEIVCQEFDFQIESTEYDEAAVVQDTTDAPDELKTRAPVVTVMGHVDHGKTSLLDMIRHSAVAAKEHGGITQHIGAYTVETEGGRTITFIDTPGHAAFTSMRARGAKVTDIVVLVVAADDGVMPQTIEAINHAKAAEVPIVVAINKMDKPEANPDRVRQQLSEHGIQPEDWGGDAMFFKVSAIKGTGIKELLEGLLLLAEVRELRANPNRRARGTIIEARQDKGVGTVMTVLVQNGTLKVGDVFVAGSEWGRVRSMVDHAGARVIEAGPSMPVGITGVSGIPMAGDDFLVLDSEAQGKEVASERAQRKLVLEQRASGNGPISLEEFSRRANSMAAAELNVVLKADVHGSLEAVTDAIEKLSTAKVKVRVLHSGVGGITESDVQLAAASTAIVIGFGVRSEARAAAEAEAHGIELRFYRIIYELIDDVKKAMAGLLEPIKKEVPLGRAEIRDVFTIPKVGAVAGCYISSGSVRRGALVRLVRDSRVVHEGRMGSLRRFKDDVKEVQSGYECGISIEGYQDVKAGDILEVFELQEFAASIE